MSGFFGNSGMQKPGREIERGERRKNAFFRYFELLIRKFSKLVVINLIYFLCILPLLCGFIVFCLNLFGAPEKIVEQISILKVFVKLSSMVPPVIAIILFLISAIFYGPVTAGLTYMLRNLVTEKHAWYSELFSRAMENFKQGLVIGVLDLAVLLSFLMYLALNVSAIEGAMHYYYDFIRIAAFLIVIYYFFMRYYLYTLAVTFDLTIKAIFKNAVIFGVLGIINNIIATFIIIIILWSFTSTPGIDIILMVSLFFSLCGFTAMFATYPIVKKYMIPEIAKKNDNEEKEGLEH